MRGQQCSAKKIVCVGGSLNWSTRVTGISARVIDPTKVPTIDKSSVDVETGRCTTCTRCDGHITNINGTWAYVLPHIEGASLSGRPAVAELCDGTITPEAYTRAIRYSIMGKRGTLRHDLQGCTPASSARGVVVPVWDSDPLTVFVHNIWLKNIVVPTRTNGSGQARAHYRARHIQKGDVAVTLRCPSVSINSIQPVTLKGWDNPCIGVHSCFCKPLHMDFDGDETHLYFVSSQRAVAEIKGIMLRTHGLGHGPLTR